MRGLSQGFQQGRPPFSQQPHRGGVTEDASESIAWRRGCRPAGAESATGPQQHRALLLVSPGPRAEAFLTGTRGRTGSRSPREPVSTESRAGGQGHVGPLLPGRSPEPQRALGVTGASPPRGDGGGTGASDRPPTPARPPRPTRGRHVRRAGGRGSTRAARELPGSPFQGPSAARPGGVRLSLRPQRSRLPQGLLSTVSRPRPYLRDAL